MSIQAFIDFKNGIPATTPEEQKKFISCMKEWMKADNISIKWLSENLGKSQGTIKNWLYAGTNIIPENQQAILTLCRNLDEGIIQASAPTPCNHNIMIYGYVKNIKSLSYWEAASAISTDPLIDDSPLRLGHGDSLKLARWFSRCIMENAKALITQKRDAIVNKTGAFSIRELPLATSSLDIQNTNDNPVIIVDKTSFNELFVLIAAKIAGFDNANDWINNLMDRVADSLIESELRSWQQRDDDIPF